MERDERLRPRPAARDHADAVGDLYRQHHPAVLRVTQALLRHGADAQDAAQEAFLKSMQSAHGFRREGPVRRWLLKIATNVAIDDQRQARTRATAELRSEPAAPVDPAVAAEAAEWERLLLRGLLDLGSELRDPLVLRYWDACSISEIAERLDIPRSTADKRCRQGLTLLRERLGPRGLRTLPPFLGTLPRVATLLESASLPPVLAGGALFMTTKAILGLVIAAAVIFCLPFFLGEHATDPSTTRGVPIGGTTDGDGTPESDRGPKPPSGTTPNPSPIVTEPFSAADAIETAAAGGWRIRGKLMLGREPAPAGSVVRVRLHAGWWDEEVAPPVSPLAEAELTVDERGRFVWRTEAPESSVTLVAQASREGFLSDSESRLIVRDEPTPNEVELQLWPLDVTVEGTIRDREGEPVANAVVHCFRERAQSDAGGRYHIRGTSYFKRQRLIAWADGFGMAREMVSTPAPGGTTHLDLVLGDGVAIEGRVLDPDGHPIANALILSWETQPNRSTTKADGAFRIAGVPLGRRATFEVIAPGFVRHREWIDEVATDLKDHDVVLSRGSAVRGIVVNAEGVAVEGARIGIGHGFSMGGTVQTVTDAEGHFAVPDVAPGKVGVHVLRRGYVQLATATVVPEPGAWSEELRLVLRPGATFLGRVVDDAGQPVAGARVATKKDGDYLEAGATTAADGTFDLADVEGPKVGVEIYRRGLVRLRQSLPIGPERLDIVVQRHGVLAGSVVDDATGEAIDRFRIRIVEATYEAGDRRASGYSSELGERGRWFTGGRFAIDDEEIAIGAVLGLEAWAEGYAPTRAPRAVLTAEPEPEALVFRLSLSAALSGTVLDAAEGTPIAGARVRWRLADAPSPEWFDFDADDAGTAIAGPDGTFRFDDLPTRPIRLEVDATGYPFLREGPISITTPGVRTERTLHLSRGAVLSGVVEDRPGTPTPDVGISLSAVDHDAGGGRRYQNTRADAAGRFRFEGLSPGRWRISRQHQIGRYGLSLYGNDVVVTAAEIHDITLHPEGDAGVILEIRSAQPLPANLTVSAASKAPAGSRPPPQTALVVKGQARFPALTAGRWRFWLHVVGDIPQAAPTSTLELDLEAGPPRTATFEMGR